MKLSCISIFLEKELRKKKNFRFYTKRVTEVVNSLTIPLSPIVKNMELNMNYHVLELHNKNGVIQQKNHILQEMVRTMINEYRLPQYLWAETINTSCYISNKIYFCKNTSKTSFEITF